MNESRFFVERWGILFFPFSILSIFPPLASSSGLRIGSSAVEFFFLSPAVF